jgi:hypothetical protein
MCDSIANGGPRAVACPPCPPANVIIASNVLDTTGNVIAGNIIAVDGTFTGNLYVAGNIVSNISYSILNVAGPINGASIWGTAYYGNAYGLSNINASNLAGTISNTNLPVVGAVGTFGDFSNVSQVTVDQYGRVTAAANVAILSSQWTTVDGNVAYQNGVSIGTLSAPPVGSNLYVFGSANITDTLNVSTLYVNSATVFGSATLNVFGVSNLSTVLASLYIGDGSGISNLNSSNLAGNVATANVAGVVTNPSQPNITSVGTLTGLNVQGLLIVSNGSGISNLNSSNLVGNVAAANVAGVVSNPSQPNITSVGTLTGLNVQGLLIVSNGSAISNLNSSNLVGNVAAANVATSVTSPAQPNITSVGTLTSLTVSGVSQAGLFVGNGSAISNINSSNLVGNVARANVALVVSQPAQPNITSVGTLTSLTVSGILNSNLFTGNGSAISNINSSNLVGNVARANVALVVSNPSQPNVTSLGTLTSLTVQGLLIASNGSGISNINGSNVSTVPTSQSVITPSQPNITSLGTLTGLYASGNVSAPFFIGGGNALSNLQVSNLSGTVNFANVAGSVVNPAQSNITSLGTLTTLSVIGSLIAGTISGDGQGLFGIHSNAIIGTVATANSVVQAAQPNITSVGTLTGLNIQGLLVASNGSGISNINSSNLTGTVPLTTLPTSGVNAGMYGSGANVSQVTVDQYGRVTLASNVPIVASQWTSVAGNVAYQNGVSIGTLSAPPVGSNLYVLGTASIGNVISNGSALSALQASNVQGSVPLANVVTLASQPNITSVGTVSTTFTVNGLLIAANASGLSNVNGANVSTVPTAQSVTVAAQTNITSVGTLTGLAISGLLVVSNGSGISNINSSNLVGNVAAANVALVVSQPSQPNITSVGTLTGLDVQGLLIVSNGSGISNLNSSNLVGNVANANVALVVSQPSQPNITSVGTLTGLNVQGLLIVSDGSGISNLNSSNLVGNVANANVALVVSKPSQPNITSVGTLTGLSVQGLLIVSNGSGISNLNSSNLVGNVANANVALVVSQASQPNITSVGTLTGLSIQGLLIASDGSGISNLNSSNLVGNVAVANVALVVSQPSQPNITSVGTLTGLSVQGLLIVSNGSGISNLNSSNLVGNVANANVALVVSQPSQPNITSVGTLTGLAISGLLVVSNGSGISNLNSSNLVGNVANANVALVVSQPSQPNITSVGTLTGLYSSGNITATFFTGEGNGLTNIQSSILVGNVANANVALVVSQPAQPNITSVGTLTSLTVSGVLNASLLTGNASGISNLNSSNLVGNVANANVALVVSQPAQPNITSVGTLTGLTINGLLIASDGSGISNLNSSNLVGNVASANTALVVTQPSQPNITSVGTLTGLAISGLLVVSNGSGISNLNSSNLVGNVANANVALVVSQPSQPNITSVGTLTALTTGNLTVTSNILPGTIDGNTYLDGNIIVSGNVFSALGMPLGSGGGYYLSLPADIALQVPYTGAVYGVTYPLSVGLSNGFTISGTSTLITVTPNGNFQFGVAGPYLLRAVFNSSDNIKGLAVGSNVADVHGTDQGYMHRYTTFITQNPTELIEIPFDVTDVSKYYYLDLFSVDGGTLRQTANTSGGTYMTITPLTGGGLATGGPGGTPGTQWISSGSNIYYSNSVGIGAVNPQYKLDVSGDLRVTGNIYGNVFGTTLYSVVTGLTSNYTALASDYYIGVSGARKVTLPLGSSVPVGKSYVVKDEAGNASVTSILLQASGSDIIDGNSNVTMALNNISLTTLWTGSRWSLI